MGTDIHGWVEAKGKMIRKHKNNEIIDRTYDMFGCLFVEKHVYFEHVPSYEAPEDTSLDKRDIKMEYEN